MAFDYEKRQAERLDCDHSSSRPDERAFLFGEKTRLVRDFGYLVVDESWRLGAAILQQGGTQFRSLRIYNRPGEAMVSAQLTIYTALLELQILMSPPALRLQHRRCARPPSLLRRNEDCDAVTCIAQKLGMPGSYNKLGSLYSFRCLEM